MDTNDKIDELLNTPYWIIDILPMQVPAKREGQYFAVEEYFLKEQIREIKQKHINMILKLNCYKNITIDEAMNPSPEQIGDIMNKRFVYIMVGDAMILSEPDDTHMTVFNPEESLLDLLKDLSVGEGLYIWKPPQEQI